MMHSGGGRLATAFPEETRAYTGIELRPHFLLTELSLRGTGIGAFIGSCHVRTDDLVDWEDRLAFDRIEAQSMVHFIGEFFGGSLREGVLIQRLFMALAFETLNARLATGASPFRLRRAGDDLFVERAGEPRKLSVSIVTASPVSLLLHVGINIDPAGAPVPAIGLNELGVNPRDWATELLQRFVEEWEGMEWACVKVRPVM